MGQLGFLSFDTENKKWIFKYYTLGDKLSYSLTINTVGVKPPPYMKSDKLTFLKGLLVASRVVEGVVVETEID